MKNTLKGYLIGVLSAILLLGTVCYAASNTKTIEALFNNIKIYVDGVKIDPKDANGNAVEPFIYNGTTYLPVRAVGQAIGKTVTWDGATQSVYLGEKPGDVQYLVDVCPPYQTFACEIFPSEKSSFFEMAGKKKSNGISLNSYGYAIFNLDGKYESLTLDIGCVDNKYNRSGSVQFIVDGRIIAEYETKYDELPKTVEIPLNYGMQLKIYQNNGYEGGNPVYSGMANMIVK